MCKWDWEMYLDFNGIALYMNESWYCIGITHYHLHTALKRHISSYKKKIKKHRKDAQLRLPKYGKKKTNLVA